MVSLWLFLLFDFLEIIKDTVMQIIEKQNDRFNKTREFPSHSLFGF